MSVSTNVYVVKQHDIDDFMFEVVKALKKRFGNNFIEDSVKWRDCNRGRSIPSESEFFDLNFTLDYEEPGFANNKENRSISIFHYPNQEMKRDFFNLYFNAWGHNKEIADCLVDYFGGFADYSDSDSIEIDYCVAQHQSLLGIKD
jgi:hypothetical protein